MIFIFIIFILIIRHRKFPHFIILTSSIQITFSDLKQLKARHAEYDQCNHKNHIGDYIPFFLPPSSAVMFFSFIVCIFISHSGFDPFLCHSRGCDHSHVLHSCFRGPAVDSMNIFYADIIHCHICCTECCIYCHDPFHRTSVIASVTDHSGQTACHILNHFCMFFSIRSLQICQSTGHPGSGCNPAAAKCR